MDFNFLEINNQSLKRIEPTQTSIFSNSLCNTVMLNIELRTNLFKLPNTNELEFMIGPRSSCIIKNNFFYAFDPKIGITKLKEDLNSLIILNRNNNASFINDKDEGKLFCYNNRLFILNSNFHKKDKFLETTHSFSDIFKIYDLETLEKSSDKTIKFDEKSSLI